MSLKELEERIESLEMMAHPPVAWEEKIKQIREELDHLYEKLARYGL